VIQTQQTQLHDLSALQQAAAVRSGELSPVELARHYLDRIEEHDGAIGAFVTVTPGLALELAHRAERAATEARRQGRPLPALHGVPVAVKDNTRIEDVECGIGSAAYAEQVSDLDDHVVTRMKDGGLVILGTTSTPEFALPCYTETAIGPPTRNPHDPRYSPGGSSGGSAAAVAAGLAPIAQGTDAGGSVRIPASACGLVGLKPSRGRVSNGPTAHDITGLSVHGTLARTVADAEALLEIMAGPMAGDAYTAPGTRVRAGGPGGPAAQAVASGLRIAVMAEPMVPDVTVHQDCLDALDSAAGSLRAAGHQVDVVEMNPDAGVAEAFGRAWSVVAARVPVPLEDEHLLTPFTRYLRRRGREVSGEQLHEALSVFRGIGQLMADLFFSAYDVILTPTLAQPPALIGAFSSDPDPAADFDRMTRFMPYTPLYNLTGQPALSVPTHRNADGLPIGVMLGGRYGEEALILSLAGQLEAPQ
jgi:amidase